MSDRVFGPIRRRLDAAESGRERGAVIVLFSLILTVLMAMAALTVDLGWLYYTGARAQRAADAASLAGVVHLPTPSPIVSGEPAHDAAIDIAGRNGFIDGINTAVVTPRAVPGSRFQLEVTVQYDAPTFFMKLFGLDPQRVIRRSVAEQLPQIRLGGRGNDIGDRAADGYWVAINGDLTPAEQGDHLATQCSQPASNSCNFSNGHYQDPAYYYGVELRSAGLNLDVYDAPAFDYDGQAGAGGNFDINWEAGSGSPHVTTFNVYPPDNTPGDPRDNSLQPAICSISFQHGSNDPVEDPFNPGVFMDQATYSTTFRNQWVNLCNDPMAPKGLYIIQMVSSAGNTSNTYSLREGSPSTRLYAIEWISVHGSNSGSKFDLAEVPPEYEDRKIIVTLYDPGENDGDSFVTIKQEGVDRDCEFRVLDLEGNVLQGWGPDDQAGAVCKIQTSDATLPSCSPPSTTGCRLYNEQFLEVRFDLTGYTCTIGTDCYWVVDYDYQGATVSDRTTWGITVQGQPIHLIPDAAPPAP